MSKLFTWEEEEVEADSYDLLDLLQILALGQALLGPGPLTALLGKLLAPWARRLPIEGIQRLL